MNKIRIFALTTKIILICILLAGVASANPPIVLEGTVTIDGNPAPAGTVIKAMCGEEVVGTTTVDNAGYYSDTRDNKLGISSVLEECSSVTLYVNNIKTEDVDISSMNAGDIVTVNLQATTSTSSSSSESTKTTSGGGGGFSSASVEEETPVEEVAEEIPEEEAMSSVEDTLAEEEVAEEEESVPVEETEAQSADFPTVVGIGSMLVVAGILIRKKNE
ncbi:hypothetical protein MettiDRAFT_2661 [Methanolobus tindarius DSM 2278]|uniref:Uncharacterized protein n=1 Tax=Methanolobus tindarius DSM 2278 TaxID=1090322 RepID=W9DZQ2_METTI|nr:hypothetical protein [Methanolobus tindarius]ETA69167.1 hypothetical protein MettiDRAFT_2661 [Methanolobus tindarius DSM 2278]